MASMIELHNHPMFFPRFVRFFGRERVNAITNARVSGGSFRYAYDGIGNRQISLHGQNHEWNRKRKTKCIATQAISGFF